MRLSIIILSWFLTWTAPARAGDQCFEIKGPVSTICPKDHKQVRPDIPQSGPSECVVNGGYVNWVNREPIFPALCDNGNHYNSDLKKGLFSTVKMKFRSSSVGPASGSVTCKDGTIHLYHSANKANAELDREVKRICSRRKGIKNLVAGCVPVIKEGKTNITTSNNPCHSDISTLLVQSGSKTYFCHVDGDCRTIAVKLKSMLPNISEACKFDGSSGYTFQPPGVKNYISFNPIHFSFPCREMKPESECK